MMRIDVITLFPEMFSALQSGITGRAQRKKQFILTLYPLRDYAARPGGQVDDRPYGGGPGMVLQYPPLTKAITAAQRSHHTSTKVIYLSPQGRTLTQANIQALSRRQRLTLICGRYEGIDERVITHWVDEEWSVGDYVVSGGELPAMLLIDAMVRLLPGVLGHEHSADQDSFSRGRLDYPHYTRPDHINHLVAPDLLLNGNHAAIARWRLMQSLGKTWQNRPDLLEKHPLCEQEEVLLREYIEQHRGTTQD